MSNEALNWSEADLRNSLTDPVREMFREKNQKPDLDVIMNLFPKTQGEPAFDSQLIENNIKRLETVPEVDTGHPFLDRAVKVGLAHIDATFQGNRPKYGIKGYASTRHDSFPPTIIAAVDALSVWGMHERAQELFSYWLKTMVLPDGQIDNYGPSITEYGQILHSAALLIERSGTASCSSEWTVVLERMVKYLVGLCRDDEDVHGLILGGPENDECDNIARYFHNSLWAARGLRRWADMCDGLGSSSSISLNRVRDIADRLVQNTLNIIKHMSPKDPADHWIPARLEPVTRPENLRQTRYSNYTNYRYWPEMLSSELLPSEVGNRLVEARLNWGGQFCGMTRMHDFLDNWPLADYLFGLWHLERKDDFLLSLFGHISYHQAEGHLTAYESVKFPPPCGESAPYCLPCQLVATRVAPLLQQSEP